MTRAEIERRLRSGIRARCTCPLAYTLDKGKHGPTCPVPDMLSWLDVLLVPARCDCGRVSPTPYEHARTCPVYAPPPPKHDGPQTLSCGCMYGHAQRIKACEAHT